MKKRLIGFTDRHDKLLTDLAKRMGIAKAEVVRRALELMEEKEAQRDKEVKP